MAAIETPSGDPGLQKELSSGGPSMSAAYGEDVERQWRRWRKWLGNKQQRGPGNRVPRDSNVRKLSFSVQLVVIDVAILRLARNGIEEQSALAERMPAIEVEHVDQ